MQFTGLLTNGCQSCHTDPHRGAFRDMGLKESCDRLQLLAGDRLDIAYSLGMNDHPEFGGLELTLRDLLRALLRAQ